jgi:hypothetical protein
MVASDGEPLVLAADDPVAVALVAAVRAGDLEALRSALAERPELARAVIADPCGGGTRTTLHVVTDWPGHFPNGADVVRVLVAAGADVDARPGAAEGEAPLHWAASSDDVEVLDALLDAGADIDITGAVIAGGTPLTDAVAFGQWRAARRLVERGAHVPLREAAALGLTALVEDRLAEGPATAEDVDQAFWYASHGAQPVTVELLASRGADLRWVSPWDGLSPLDAAERTAGELSGTDRDRADAVVAWLRERGAGAAGPSP